MDLYYVYVAENNGCVLNCICIECLKSEHFVKLDLINNICEISSL